MNRETVSKWIIPSAVLLILSQMGGCPSPSGNMSLTVTTSGQGTVAMDPVGGSYKSNTVVTLTATPSSGWAFDHWEGGVTGTTNPTTVTMSADVDVTAVFVQGSSSTCNEWTQTDITTNTTIPAGCWLVNDSINVSNGAVLTLAPARRCNSVAGWACSWAATVP